jgi:hypothetical protein
MGETRNTSDRSTLPDGAKPPGSGKRAYVKPAFIWERAFETMALSCGKINITQAQCKSNRKNS